MTAWVYILGCSDDSYYVGSTRDSLEARLAQHQDGTYRGYTFFRRPVHLLWSQDFSSITDAVAAERKVKGWRRAKKEALIRGDYDALPALSSRKKPISDPHPEEPRSGVSKGAARYEIPYPKETES